MGIIEYHILKGRHRVDSRRWNCDPSRETSRRPRSFSRRSSKISGVGPTHMLMWCSPVQRLRRRALSDSHSCSPTASSALEAPRTPGGLQLHKVGQRSWLQCHQAGGFASAEQLWELANGTGTLNPASSSDVEPILAECWFTSILHGNHTREPHRESGFAMLVGWKWFHRGAARRGSVERNHSTLLPPCGNHTHPDPRTQFRIHSPLLRCPTPPPTRKPWTLHRGSYTVDPHRGVKFIYTIPNCSVLLFSRGYWGVRQLVVNEVRLHLIDCKSFSVLYCTWSGTSDPYHNLVPWSCTIPWSGICDWVNCFLLLNSDNCRFVFSFRGF